MVIIYTHVKPLVTSQNECLNEAGKRKKPNNYINIYKHKSNKRFLIATTLKKSMLSGIIWHFSFRLLSLHTKIGYL